MAFAAPPPSREAENTTSPIRARAHNLQSSAWRPLAPAIALGVLGAVVTISQMALLSNVIGRVLVGRQRFRQLLPLLLLLLLAVVLRSLLAWREEVSAQSAALGVTRALRERLVAALLQLGPGYLRHERSGELATTATEGIDRLTTYYQRYVPLQAVSVLVPIVVVLYLLTIDPLGALLLVGTAPLIPLFMVLIGSHAETKVQLHWLALSRLGAQFLDTLQGLPTLLHFGRGDAAGERVRATSQAFQERTLQVLQVAFLSGMVLDIVTGMAIGLVAVVVAIQLLSGSLAFASALLVLLLAPECYRPLRELGAQRHAALEGKAAGRRIQEIIQAVPAGVALPASGHGGDQAAPLSPIGGNRPGSPPTVVFAGVTYRYRDSGPVAGPSSASTGPAVADVTLTLAAGSRTALVGRSGAGKSTLINLLLRFIEPDAGTITVRGVALSTLRPELWRSGVALVPQQPHLFAGTIADNLRLARPDADMADLVAAAEQAGAAEFIARLPGGYAAPVGEQGARLSAGQVQRLAIARAFLKDAPLLILDEPTSALDPEHEIHVRRTLDQLMTGRTVLIVAHRLNTVRTAGQIAVLQDGRVVETGRHQDLLAQDGVYAQLMGSATRGTSRCS